MKSKIYLFLNSYRIIIALMLIVFILVIYNFSNNNNRFTILEGMLMKTNSDQAKDQIEKAYKKKEAEHKGNVTQNERKYVKMHDRAF